MTVRMDETAFGNLVIAQDPDGFRYGVDAVMLAGFAAKHLTVRRKTSGRLCDLGTGNGIIPLIMSYTTEIPELTGVELQENSYRLALETASANGLTDRLRFFHMDVKNIRKGSAELAELGGAGSFGVVTINPPYVRVLHKTETDGTPKETATHELTGNLSEFLQAASVLLSDRGDLFLVHRPARMAEIFNLCFLLRLEPKRLKLFGGTSRKRPNLLFLHCIKNGAPGMLVEKQGYVREEDGSFSEEVLEFYRLGSN